MLCMAMACRTRCWPSGVMAGEMPSEASSANASSTAPTGLRCSAPRMSLATQEYGLATSPDSPIHAAHVAGRPEAEPHEREPQVHEAAPEDQQAGTAPLAVHFVNPKQHYQQAGDENSHL